jgi:hypothetical protein
MRRAALFASISVALGLAACSGTARDSFYDSSRPSDDAGTEPPPSGFADGGRGDATPTGECTEDVDVVFALDVSSSMGFVLDKLGTEIEQVVSAANDLKEGAHFGLVLFVDNVKVDDSGSAGDGKIHTGAASLQSAFSYAKTTYTTPNRNPGDGPTGPTTQNPICEENALDALHDAVTEFPWRDNAARVVIVVTDDTFLERPDNYGDRDGDGKTDKTNFPREGDYPARFTVDETVSALTKAGVRVFSFTRLKPPGLLDPTACGTGRRHASAEAITYGWSQPYAGKQPIPTATGGKNFDLDAVRGGSLSLAATINEVVLESHCAGPR